MSSSAQTRVRGKLHCAVALDWGEEVDLERAAQLVPTEPGALPRRRRTPASIAYRPAPLRCRLAPTRLAIEPDVQGEAEVEAMVFDFGATNIVFRLPFELELEQLPRLAAALAEPQWLVSQARAAAQPLFVALQAAIQDPTWSELYEEYYVFQLEPNSLTASAAELLRAPPRWLTAMLRLDDGTLADEEVVETMRCRISYRPDDLVIIDSSAAVVIDTDCDETLHAIEFANLQLLEYRLIDVKVGDALTRAQRLIRSTTRWWLPFWRAHARPLRVLNEMRVDAVGTFERAGGALQLVGDQYLARVYRLLAERFRLTEWAENVRRALDVTEGVHEILSSQSAATRLELLELTVVVLILIEILLASLAH